SCPLTQNGVIRIMSQPSYPNPLTPALIAERLAEATATAWHEFWPDDISLLDREILNWDAVLGSRQITDCFLLAMAVQHQGRFASFDQRVNLRAVRSAEPQHFVIIG
ncbi:MAG: VapC toxin family PIN domain ribonuclease, partial [Wenzhouxiangella sp.]